jgi:hypothetical protein
MSKSDYKRTSGSSLCPDASAANAAEYAKDQIRQVGKAKYYSQLSYRGGHWKKVLPRMTDAELKKQKAHSRRADLIAEIAGGVKK